MEAYKDDILDMRRRGISKQEIALTLRVNSKKVASALKEWGDPFPLPASQRVEAARDEIIAARRRGETREKIAQRYGCGTDTIRRKLREWGETNQRGGRYDKAEMQRLRDAGLTCREIAKRLGCAEATVFAYTWVRESEPKEEKPVHAPVSKYEPGKRYGDYTFLEMVEARRPLWLFEHRCGWRETFTENQLKEARMA
ncbi:MAG: Helix-turn-helix domain of resolvase [Spirochaetes bacterium ADurb.BinA120]|nr:MAG: Helix-turn-helix domain of resolvase [Spirochaetes bacterium ADurb.BinA120]